MRSGITNTLVGLDTHRPLRVGEIVRLRNGHSPLKVLEVDNSQPFCYPQITTRYINTRGVIQRSEDQFVPYEELQQETEGRTAMKSTTLYEIKNGDTVAYGTYLATNSSGQYVMEKKGTGEILTADKCDVSEVVPYTIGVKFLTGYDNGTVYHYTSKKDKFQTGDLFVYKNQNGTSLVLIESVDTRSKKATKEFTPISKVSVEAL